MLLIGYNFIYQFVNQMRVLFLREHALIQEVRIDDRINTHNRVTILRATVRRHHLNRGENTNDATRNMIRTQRDAYRQDDAGHIIGQRLGGPRASHNIFPQNVRVNRGAHRAMENRTYNWVNGGNGRYAEVHVRLDYGSERRRRPESVTYWVRLMNRDGTEASQCGETHRNPPPSSPNTTNRPRKRPRPHDELRRRGG